MSLDTCFITIKGNGFGGNGHPKQDTTRNVRGFLKDNDIYYKAVLTHLRGCADCDPEEALREFLKNRDGDKKGGLVSEGLLKMAMRYERTFVKERPGISDVVNEFLIRGSGSGHDTYFENCYRLGAEGILRGLRMKYSHWQTRVLRGGRNGSPMSPFPRVTGHKTGMARVTCLMYERLNKLLVATTTNGLLDDFKPFPPDDETLQWCFVAEVMYT